MALPNPSTDPRVAEIAAFLLAKYAKCEEKEMTPKIAQKFAQMAIAVTRSGEGIPGFIPKHDRPVDIQYAERLAGERCTCHPN